MNLVSQHDLMGQPGRSLHHQYGHESPSFESIALTVQHHHHPYDTDHHNQYVTPQLAQSKKRTEIYSPPSQYGRLPEALFDERNDLRDFGFKCLLMLACMLVIAVMLVLLLPSLNGGRLPPPPSSASPSSSPVLGPSS